MVWVGFSWVTMATISWTKRGACVPFGLEGKNQLLECFGQKLSSQEIRGRPRCPCSWRAEGADSSQRPHLSDEQANIPQRDLQLQEIV